MAVVTTTTYVTSASPSILDETRRSHFYGTDVTCTRSDGYSYRETHDFYGKSIFITLHGITMYDYKRDFYGGQLRTNAFGRHINSVTDFKFLPLAGLPPHNTPTTVIVHPSPPRHQPR